MKTVMTVRNLLFIALGLFLVRPVGNQAQENPSQELRVIFPVTCVSPGLAKALIDSFESAYKIPTKMYSLCTGDAISFIKEHEGIEEVDVMIGHDIEAEERFVKEGYAVNLRSVCYSDYVLVGPPDDPAKIKGMKSAAKALETIARKKATFCSRADSSGTNALEMRIWKMAKIKPRGDWYLQTKVGTSETLLIAARKRAYFISHWATFSEMAETVDLAPLVEDPKHLITAYEVMAMNPERFPKVKYVDAMLFIGFLTSPPIQKYIGEFGIEKYGRPVFIPMAVKSNQQQKGKK
jgi:tungstate transport system substrate-binding protein